MTRRLTPAEQMAAAVPCLGRCGRLLRDPQYQARGYGPVCWARHHSPDTGNRHTTNPAPLARATTSSSETPVPHIPGQTALPLPVQTALTWST